MDHFQYFNKFPEDIQRLVFEYAFEGFEPVKQKAAAVELALVSKQTHRWIAPLIYRNISTSRMQGISLQDASRPIEFLRNNVKSLSVDDMSESNFLEDILSECHDNLVGLAWCTITHNRKKWASFLFTREFPSLRKLSVYYGIFPSDLKDPFSQPIFRNLTHLDIGFPVTGAHFSAGSSITNLHKITKWNHLQSLEFLIHLHLDLKLALSFRDPGVTDNFQALILDVLSNLPPNTKYFSINLPSAFLDQAARLPVDARRIYDDFICGITDSRTLVCYQPSVRWSLDAASSLHRRMHRAYISVPGFSKYLLPRDRTQDDRIFRVAIPKFESVNGFWEEAERWIRKRNRELYGN